MLTVKSTTQYNIHKSSQNSGIQENLMVIIFLVRNLNDAVRTDKPQLDRMDMTQTMHFTHDQE